MQTKQKAKKVDNQSKKIKKPESNKFSALVQDKVAKKARVIDDRKTLIQEYRLSKNKNEVQDKRFLRKRAPDNKLLQNLERKKNKKSIFNLDSDDEQAPNEEMKLTHKGVDIDQLNDYKEDEFDKEGSEDENINARLVNDFHFEGFDGEEERNEENFNEKKKTKQEIYRELIHKSKKEKFLRQQAALQMQEKVEELDEEFMSIIGLLSKNPEQHKLKRTQMAKTDNYLALQHQLQGDRKIKPDAINTLDPDREDKKKGKRRRRGGDVEEEKDENDDSSDYGDDEEIVGKKKKERKMKDAVKKQEKTNKLMGFLDDIKASKAKGSDEEDEDDDLDDADLSDDEDEEGEDDMDDDEDGLGDEDDDMGDDDEY